MGENRQTHPGNRERLNTYYLGENWHDALVRSVHVASCLDRGRLQMVIEI